MVPHESDKDSAVILYEYPFNERIRTYLRLEHLFRRLGDLVQRNSPTDHHYAITTIFEIMDVGARADLKTDVLKDLEKQKHVLVGYRGNPAVSGKAGQSLTENDWLMSIRSRVGIPGGTCEFDLPAYYAWQHKSADLRQADLQRWIAPLVPLAESVRVLLSLLRDSGAPQKVVAPAGHYQQTLPQGRTFQLLRMRIDPALGLSPEISGNRLMVSVRLMRHESDDRLHASSDDSMFELSLCA